MIIGILAGEPSGDSLGAGLMRAMRARGGEIEFVGIGGPLMQAQGLRTLAPFERLTMNGFAEPIRRLPELVGVLRTLLRSYSELQPVAFIGVDFNVFNFVVERLLKRRGVPTVHYVSPSVYAWRTGRVRRMSRCVDLLLTLYPFEPAFYPEGSVDAVFVGHPLADEIGPEAGSTAARSAARDSLGLADAGHVIAVLPGSRDSEVKLLLEDFLGACERLDQQLEGAAFVLPCVSPRISRQVSDRLRQHPQLRCATYEGNARQALVACDAALVKAGTGTLEALLLKRPMVVSYRLGRLSAVLVRPLLKTPYLGLPNILAGRRLVPELLQADATADRLATAVLGEMARAEKQPDLLQAFAEIHESLRRGADDRAAGVVLDWLGTKPVSADAV